MTSRRTGRHLAIAVLVLVGVSTVTACSAGGAAASLTPPPEVEASIDANNLAFSTAELAVPADTPFEMFFRNLEGVPHNVAVYRDSSAADKIFVGETITNAAVTYEVPALAPGEYFFRCDVHPDMTGTMTAG